MKFIFENMNNLYEKNFIIKRNSAGNFCAYHINKNLAYIRKTLDGNEEQMPFCWCGRKKYLEDALNDICTYYPNEVNKQFLNKDIAKYFNIKTYGNPYEHWVQYTEDFTYNGSDWYYGDTEIVSDSSDEIPEKPEEKLSYYENPFGTYRITIQGKEPLYLDAKNRKDAAIKARQIYNDKIKILGINLI